VRLRTALLALVLTGMAGFYAGNSLRRTEVTVGCLATTCQLTVNDDDPVLVERFGPTGDKTFTVNLRLRGSEITGVAAWGRFIAGREVRKHPANLVPF